MAVITVFASSSPRTPARYLDLAAALGRQIAEQGHVLVNGAGRFGCMGALNDACLAVGGRARGVILRRFQEEGLGHPGLADTQVADDMPTRRRLLAETADAFIALPGGPGTWEEFWEVAVQRQIGLHRKPLVLVNTTGFYDGFLAQAQRAAEEGFLYGAVGDLFVTAGNIPTALALATAAFTRG